jgi:2-desacetyl-2-hydroxyethyl bacteriochlorophyllide A dehydrogenase
MLSEGVVIHGREDFRYEAFEIPELRDEEVLVEIESCGICAADPKIYYGTAYFAEVAYRNAPIVAGHEFMGRVVALGPGAAEKHGLKIGDRAIAENIVPCGKCYWCKRGQYNLCDPHAVFGIVEYDGGWARHMVYPKRAIVHKVPDSVRWADAAIVEPLACALHGVNRAQIQFGETVVVMGCGAIGLLMIQGATLKNPKQVIALDLNDHRLDVARDLGADHTINPAREDAVERVRSLTEDQIGCDVVLEVAGTNKSVRSAIDMLRRGGRLMEFAVFAEEVSFDWSVISDIKELEIVGGHLGFHTYAPAIDFLSRGLITSRGIASEPFALTDFKHALDVSKGAKEGAIKVLMRPE